MFKQAGYYKLGLLAHDMLNETPVVAEAIRRLPKEVQDQRNYRILRAVQCSITQSILPKNDWTKFEDDVPYLEPYIKEVEAEEAEKKEWYRTH